MLLSPRAIGYLRKLLSDGVIDLSVHEEIIEKVTLFSESGIGVEEISIIASMVLLERDYNDWHSNLPYQYNAHIRTGYNH